MFLARVVDGDRHIELWIIKEDKIPKEKAPDFRERERAFFKGAEAGDIQLQSFYTDQTCMGW